ncbi:MAG: secretin N-terminal domain-containing protein [Verrucomicrobiota bacterium]
MLSFASARHCALLALLALVCPSTGWSQGSGVLLQFPLNGVNDVLPVYERLTGRTVIRDTSIFDGPQISLLTSQEVPADEAVRLIEAALTLNGYVIVDGGDGKTRKILLGRTGDSAGNFNSGSEVIMSPSQLPPGEGLISYFLSLEFLSPEDAAVIMTNHVELNPYGRVTPVEAPAGLLLTETAGIVRQLIQLKALIDVPSSEARLMTEFVQLLYADSNTVAQIIQATMDARFAESQRLTDLGESVGNQQRQGQNNGNNNNQAQRTRDQGTTGNSLGTANNPQAQLIADDRLNRIFVQAAPTDFAFILGLIRQFDQPLPDEEPLEWVLNYVKVIDVLPVIVDILTDKGSGTTQLPGGRSLDTRQPPASSTSLSSLAGLQDGVDDRFVQQTGTEDGEEADRLLFPDDEVAPVSVLVGKTRIIADRQANSILLIGPQASKISVSRLLERLDRKPPQVYLGVVIGQLSLGRDLDVGVDYLKQFQTFDPSNGAEGFSSGLIAGRPDIVTNGNVADVRNNIISNAFGPVTGFNFYGAIGSQLDVFVSALETSNRFKVLSRPVLSVQNNKRASITNGQKIPIPENTLADATAGTTTLNTTITFENVVLKLEVIPRINSNDEVTLEIVQVNDTVVGSQVVGDNDVPIIGTEELTTTVSVPNLQTIVLGGLITESFDKEDTGLPVVSRLPVVGQAFRRTQKDVERNELLIFIQPVVIRDDHDLANASFDEDIRTEVGSMAAETFPNPGEPTIQYELDVAEAAAKEAAREARRATEPTKTKGFFRMKIR